MHEDWDWEDGPPPALAFCDNYEPHEPHVYVAINSETYRCCGITAEDLAEMEAQAANTCEHGMSAALCGGPMHWYDP